MIDPDAQLNEAEQASLVAYAGTPGWKALQKLMLLQIAEFDLALKNADPANEKDVRAKHVMAKAASQFYVGLINRINQENEYFHSISETRNVQPSFTDVLTEEM